MASQATIPAILDKIMTLRDGSIKIQFETQELGGASAQELFNLRGKLCWLVVAGADMKEIIVPETPPKEFKDQKTQSQRMRAVLFVLWTRLKVLYSVHPERFDCAFPDSFDDFYRIRTESFIEKTKAEIEVLER